MFNIVEKKKIFMSVSALVIVAGLIEFFAMGFNADVDFTGGYTMSVKVVTEGDTDLTADTADTKDDASKDENKTDADADTKADDTNKDANTDANKIHLPMLTKQRIQPQKQTAQRLTLQNRLTQPMIQRTTVLLKHSL